MGQVVRESDEIIGFAFSGGGSRGASQVGALKALTEAGIRPQMVAGSSAGAVNAAWFGLNPQRLDRLETIWLALRTRDVFPGSRFSILMNLVRRGYVHRADAWENFLRAEVGNARFEDMPVKCSVVAVRLDDGARVVFDRGEIVPALMASTAIPGVFPPYRVGDAHFVDGGVLEYLPVPTLMERGATTVYGFDCSFYSTRSAHSGSIVDRCARIAARDSVERFRASISGRDTKIHILRPELPDFEDSRDFGYTAELLLAGYDHASGYLREHVIGQANVGMQSPSPRGG